MLIGEMPSSGDSIGVFSSVKTRPFFCFSGGGLGLAEGGGKGQRFGRFLQEYFTTETRGFTVQDDVMAARKRGLPIGLPRLKVGR
jgi:hypothetical protein